MSEEDKPDEQREVSFKYIKSNFFRVIHADGAWGGVAPRGDIHIAFYNERWAIPDGSRIFVAEDSGGKEKLVKPEEFETNDYVIRELEADVVVDLDTAKRLRTWLDQMIQALEAHIRESQEKAKDADEKTTSNR
jgi:hypothetical protein